jgi:lactobin A/cerein 7B family class IIb bacteriocin
VITVDDSELDQIDGGVAPILIFLGLVALLGLAEGCHVAETNGS